MAIVMLTVFLTSCEQEEIIPKINDVNLLNNLSEYESGQTNTYNIAPPNNLSIEEAIEWAKKQPLESFSESDEIFSDINSRYCSSWNTTASYDQERYCNYGGVHNGGREVISKQEKWCYGWSSSCPGNYCVKYYTRNVTQCVRR